MLDRAQLTELRGQIKRIAIFLGASTAVLWILGVDARFLTSIIVGIILICGPQLWASTRYGVSGPSTYVRIIMCRHLSLLVRTLASKHEPNRPSLIEQLRLDPLDVARLDAAKEEEHEMIAARFRQAGYPRRHKEPAPLTVLLLSLALFIAGLFLGVYFPQYVATDVRALCAVKSAQVLSPPSILVVLLVIGILVMAGSIRARNHLSAKDNSDRFEREPYNQLLNLTFHENTAWAAALRSDISRAADMVGMTARAEAAYESLGSTELESRGSWYTRIRWSPEAGIAIGQVLFVLGIYWGAVLPPLLRVGC